MRSARQAHAFYFDLNCGKSGAKIALKPRLTCFDKRRTAGGEVYFRVRLQIKAKGGKQCGTEAPLPAEPLGQSAALCVSVV